MAQGKLLLDIAVRNQQALGKVNSQLTQLQASGIKLSTVLKGAAGALVAIGATRVIGSIISTTARFEDLNDALASVTGSAREGAEAFDFVSNFATKTQFGVEDLTTTFIKLKASGIEPTEDLLTLFTDTAAVTTDQLGSLQAITDLFARTTSGGLGLEELNRLADRGVPVFRILEEQLGITRLEISEVGKTAEGSKKILNALSTGLRQDFGGATANVVDNLSTQFSNLNIALKNSANEFGQGLSPVLKDTTADLTEFIENNEETIAALGRLGGVILQGVVKLFISLAEALGAIVIGGEKLIGFFEEASKQTDHIHDDFSTLNSDFDSTGGAFQALFRDSQPVIKALGDTQMGAEEAGDSMAEAAEKIAEFAVASGDFNEEGRTTAEILEEQAREASAVARETAMMDRRFRNATASSEELNSSIGNDILLEAVKRTIGEGFTPLEASIVAVASGMEAFRSTASNALTDVIMGTKSLNDALGEIANATIKALIQGFINLGITIFVLEPLEKFLRNIKNRQKDINRELKQEIALRTVLAFFGGGGGFGIPFLANGGRAPANQPVVVGERGPELFVPNTAGEVIPNNEINQGGGSGASGGGDNINVTFNINTIDATDFNELLTTRQDLIIGLINRGLAERGKRSLTA